MASETVNDHIKQYLLGTLPEEEKSRLEEKYFDDDKLFEEIEIAEDELIDAYVREELSPSDQKRFTEILSASPRLTSRVDFARVLAKSTSFQQPATVAVPTRTDHVESPSFWQRLFPTPAPNRLGWAMAACMLLFVAGGGGLLFESLRLRGESRRLASERAELEQREKAFASQLNNQNSEMTARLEDALAENDRLLKQLESTQNETPDSKPKNLSVAFFLAPGGVRSAGRENRFVASAKYPEVRLQLGLESNNYSSYTATVKTVDDATIWSRGGIKPKNLSSGKVVELKVPTAKLPDGDYIVELTGSNTSGASQPVQNYSFRVVRH